MSRSNVPQRLRDELDSSTLAGLGQKLDTDVNRNDYTAVAAALEADFSSVQAIERA